MELILAIDLVRANDDRVTDIRAIVLRRENVNCPLSVENVIEWSYPVTAAHIAAHLRAEFRDDRSLRRSRAEDGIFGNPALIIGNGRALTKAVAELIAEKEADFAAAKAQTEWDANPRTYADLY